jgi:hypothetical protein
MTMLAWEDPYGEDDDTESSLDNYSILVRCNSSVYVRVVVLVENLNSCNITEFLYWNYKK